MLERLGEYLVSDDPEWLAVKERAQRENAWFTEEFINLQAVNIAINYLGKESLEKWVGPLRDKMNIRNRKLVGIVMAGNLPLVGFHDFICTFVSGHRQKIKLSSKDNILLPHLVKKMEEWDEAVKDYVSFSEMLKDCDAYIATGSNNSSRYFEYYFARFPHIIRKNRTSIAILTGEELPRELAALADDVYQYFGRGCRNVTKLYVPRQYDFVPLLGQFKKYDYLFHHNKYRNNYDYQFALLIINKMKYMTNGSILLVNNTELFSPVSRLHYEYYDDHGMVIESLKDNSNVQCVVGKGFVPMGTSQSPRLEDYADGTDTLQFLMSV